MHVGRDADFGFWHLRSLVWRGEENIGTTTQDADDHYAMQPRLFEGRDWDEEDDPDSSEDIEDEDEDVESDYRAVLASTDTVNTNKLPSLAAGGGRSERVVLEKNAEDVMRQPTPSQNAYVFFAAESSLASLRCTRRTVLVLPSPMGACVLRFLVSHNVVRSIEQGPTSHNAKTSFDGLGVFFCHCAMIRRAAMQGTCPSPSS